MVVLFSQTILAPTGAAGVCVNLGGDVRVAGSGPSAAGRGASSEGGGTSGRGGWTVAVEHPGWEHSVARLGLSDGAVATSTTLRRRWQIDGERRHHLIDPQTGRPSDTDVTVATVVAGQAWIAEVLAKAVILAGSSHPFDILGGTGAQALAIDERGGIQATTGLSVFLGGAALAAVV